ncbi:hypothetical protein DAPPUDRAFT_110231 [Daphnia pulex]|uniref:Uncharacterized protein n=1 Tax=Daphnia pulex TaxID=6669 RepID=E9H5E1_DAPPU|nr:hypothetical protein DAPPUDRAFT_110231 [Daphnia pulex]|eukprot:EFX72944.1 hypothetical protein DAPPUDRAFT_110231 [Daphnia pulex]
MKLALIFLSIFVAISHQQYFHPRMMFGFPWMSPFAQEPVSEEIYPDLIGYSSRNDIDQEERFVDTQSRIKGYGNNLNGLSRYRPNPSFNDQQSARFFFNWANTGNNVNNGLFSIFNSIPLFKTATFTSTQTLTLVSVVSCVPGDQVIDAPPACRRKREDFRENPESDSQFEIHPSETIKVITTATAFDSLANDQSLDFVLSSKDEITQSEMEIGPDDKNRREKRFFFNKNQFIVTSVVTTYAFVNQTITATVNLLSPPPAAGAANPCDPTVAGAFCVPCLPTGFIVCPAAAG